jgi:hypothetical protein
VSAAPTPIIVNPSPVGAQAISAVRVVVMILAASTAIMGFVGTRDLVGLILYLQSDAFLPVLASLIGIGTFIWSQLKTRNQRATEVVLAEAAPNSVAQVQTQSTPPTPSPPKRRKPR